ncbi:class III lanthionine synthetase LanKC [Streptomyces sp. ISL-11]|uniref:class III lanthionine synthetase LanKC n=1 Tax=Streptomyces sp. ISL-11 TaxID=2819174 RepID=UPI001BEA8030|nr:class III lanthionine synthetase LanKC [Streptomyces sp. ISL-11]MBT2387169.1 class III lanthionine synthetase LanKC [Streptomyces sp. ISL-11]
MDKRYAAFCLADRHFYEHPERARAGTALGGGLFEAARRPVPEGWRTDRKGDWHCLTPQGDVLPRQGWKIHVSVCPADAEKRAAQVWEYCVPRAIPFKFVASGPLLFLRNAKYADRASSGKFATLYPADDDQLHRVLRELGDLLEGEPGPAILSDLRWNDGPLYVRYGGFVRRYCDDDIGRRVLAIEDDQGRLVPDRREPVLRTPPWAPVPAFLAPHLAARSAVTLAGLLPYALEAPLHFSNGGGVYTGVDRRTGEKVVLKEARLHAGLAADGSDAVTRLEREKAALEKLSGLDMAPGVRDWLTLGDHRFLVMDFLPGRPLNSALVSRYPLVTADPDPADVAEYTRWALDTHAAVERAVTAVNSRGVVFNDLHLFNIMVGPDERSVALLDFEAATDVGEPRRRTVAHPSFIAPADRVGADADRYALACLRLALFLPLTALLGIDRRAAGDLARVVAEQFPDVPAAFLDEAVAEITRGVPARRPAPSRIRPEEDWQGCRDSLAGAILASATPGRDDRLFPGDIAQFGEGGGLGLAHGAAGVLHALAETGAGRFEDGERWLVDHSADPPAGTPLGLYDGLLGVAYALDRLGHVRPALGIVERVMTQDWKHLGPDLFGGLAGMGLVLDHFARNTGASSLRERAQDVLRLIADHLTTSRPFAGTGLMGGASGPALLFLRAYEHTGDAGLLDLAATALRRDLERCVTDAEGAMRVDEGHRLMPYIDGGGVGIGMVLDAYLAHRTDADFARARAAITRSAMSRFYAQPGLFRGRAGMILHLGRTTTPGVGRQRITDQANALMWHAVPHAGRPAFPGEQLMRLSMDLATGTAGCLLALGAALHDRPVGLPFLPPLPREHVPAPTRGRSAGAEPAQPSPHERSLS